MEAMAAGRSVTSADCESGPREILDHGLYGQLVPVGDIHSMAQAILATINSRPDSQKLKARAREFSLAASVIQYEKLIRSR